MKNVATTSESCSDTEINQIQDLANSVNKKNDDSLILKYCRMKYDDGESDSQDFTDMEEDFSKGADGDSFIVITLDSFIVGAFKYGRFFWD